MDLPEPQNILAFFVAATELVDHAAPQQVILNGQQLLLQQPLNTYFSAAPQQLEIVLITADDKAYSVQLQQANNAGTDILITQGQQDPTALWLILLLAGAGGVLLNLMPCVFPVLSLKALSIAASGQVRQQQQLQALWYSLGVVLSFVMLAILLIVLRGAGAAVGADASRVSATGVLLSCVAICASPPSSGACTLTLFRFTGAFAFRTTASPPSAGVSLRDVFSWFSVTCIGTPSKFIRAHEATPRMQSRWGNHAIAFGEPTIGPRPRPQGSCST